MGKRKLPVAAAPTAPAAPTARAAAAASRAGGDDQKEQRASLDSVRLVMREHGAGLAGMTSAAGSLRGQRGPARVLVLAAPTGKGKSTVANYLAGVPMERVAETDEKCAKGTIRVREGHKEIFGIGHRQGVSETFVPKVVPVVRERGYIERAGAAVFQMVAGRRHRGRRRRRGGRPAGDSRGNAAAAPDADFHVVDLPGLADNRTSDHRVAVAAMTTSVMRAMPRSEKRCRATLCYMLDWKEALGEVERLVCVTVAYERLLSLLAGSPPGLAAAAGVPGGESPARKLVRVLSAGYLGRDAMPKRAATADEILRLWRGVRVRFLVNRAPAGATSADFRDAMARETEALLGKRAGGGSGALAPGVEAMLRLMAERAVVVHPASADRRGDTVAEVFQPAKRVNRSPAETLHPAWFRADTAAEAIVRSDILPELRLQASRLARACNGMSALVRVASKAGRDAKGHDAAAQNLARQKKRALVVRGECETSIGELVAEYERTKAAIARMAREVSEQRDTAEKERAVLREHDTPDVVPLHEFRPNTVSPSIVRKWFGSTHRETLTLPAAKRVRDRTIGQFEIEGGGRENSLAAVTQALCFDTQFRLEVKGGAGVIIHVMCPKRYHPHHCHIVERARAEEKRLSDEIRKTEDNIRNARKRAASLAEQLGQEQRRDEDARASIPRLDREARDAGHKAHAARKAAAEAEAKLKRAHGLAVRALGPNARQLVEDAFLLHTFSECVHMASDVVCACSLWAEAANEAAGAGVAHVAPPGYSAATSKRLAALLNDNNAGGATAGNGAATDASWQALSTVVLASGLLMAMHVVSQLVAA